MANSERVQLSNNKFNAESMLAVSQMSRKQTWDALNAKKHHYFTVIRALTARLHGTVSFLNGIFSDQQPHQAVVGEYEFYMLRSNIIDSLQEMQVQLPAYVSLVQQSVNTITFARCRCRPASSLSNSDY